MDDTLPNDLPGGWDFDKPFSAEHLAVGQVWRKAGPSDAVKIERVMQPGQAEHDGEMPGISVRRTEIASKVRRWAIFGRKRIRASKTMNEAFGVGAGRPR